MLNDLNNKTIVISRTDSIGDVVLTLPVCGFLKEKFPNCKIIFIGRNYTLPIIDRCQFVDESISFDTLEKHNPSELVDFLKTKNIDVFVHVFPKRELAIAAHKAGIKIRIGTARRLFHLFTCNKKVNLKRKKSNLHEAQLNIALLRTLIEDTIVPLEKIANYYGFNANKKTNTDFSFLDHNKIKIILHPKSKGSAREWGIENYSELIRLLPSSKYQLFFSGTKAEGDLFRKELIEKHTDVIDVTGKFSLEEFIDFISACDGLVAASTGPLHIAAALGKKAIGLYSPKRPIFPTRWAPIGKHASYLIEASDKEMHTTLQISAAQVAHELEKN